MTGERRRIRDRRGRRRMTVRNVREPQISLMHVRRQDENSFEGTALTSATTVAGLHAGVARV